MNEADTRAELIDPQLEAAGWKTDLATGVRVLREYAITDGEIKPGGMRTGRMKADYVLEYRTIKLAVVEAKSRDLDVSEGVGQAKLYAAKLQLQSGFAANGREIYQIDHSTNSEGKIAAFPSPETLWQRTFRAANHWRDQLNAVPLELGAGKQSRYYQELAVQRTIEAIADGRDRILLTLATGTGKTFIAFQIAWKLFQRRWTSKKDGKRRPRILFLADRNILANQAYNAFDRFADDARARIDPGEIKRRGTVPKNASIFFTIFQTFMSGPDGAPYFGDYPRDFFDVIFIDECHRGGANDESSWRAILDYFAPAAHIGLTATPKRTDNANTYAYFGEPVFTYPLKDGIKDGFLTPFKVQRIQTTIDEYGWTSDDEVLEGEVEEGRIYQEEEFNKKIEIEAREQKRVQLMLDAIDAGDKTIIFCASQAHAAMVRDLTNQEARRAGLTKDDHYCARVTADEDHGDLYLAQFQDNEKTIPTILTTSRKLTTGVDARNVRNIVLLRPIHSMIEFKQIIGRGTRLFDGKHFFTVLDFVRAYHLFNDPEWDGEPIELEDLDATKSEQEPGTPDDEHEADSDRAAVDDSGDYGEGGEKQPKTKLRIRLGDGRIREIQSMTSTLFYLDGKLVSAEAFVRGFFDAINQSEFFQNEEELRRLWAHPQTRNELLGKLDQAGFAKDDLEKLQRLCHGEDSDLFDVLAYIAWARPPVTRKARVAGSRDNIYALLSSQQREFVAYLLRNYIEAGVGELDIDRLGTILEAKYGSMHAAKQELGNPSSIKTTFIEFQQLLYCQDAA